MHITTFSQLDAPVVRALREQRQLGQAAFWNRLGVSRETGSNYEHGRTRIPAPVQRLLFAYYLARLPMDRPAELLRLGQALALLNIPTTGEHDGNHHHD